jgi:hypothetical protein
MATLGLYILESDMRMIDATAVGTEANFIELRWRGWHPVPGLDGAWRLAKRPAQGPRRGF